MQPQPFLLVFAVHAPRNELPQVSRSRLRGMPTATLHFRSLRFLCHAAVDLPAAVAPVAVGLGAAVPAAALPYAGVRGLSGTGRPRTIRCAAPAAQLRRLRLARHFRSLRFLCHAAAISRHPSHLYPSASRAAVPAAARRHALGAAAGVPAACSTVGGTMRRRRIPRRCRTERRNPPACGNRPPLPLGCRCGRNAPTGRARRGLHHHLE